jgi:hypothetical protein
MDVQDLDRIRFVTRHFNDLQGLRYAVPLGLIACGLGGGPALLRVVLFAGAFLLTLGARRYYRSAFGEVQPQPADPAAELCAATVFSPAGPAPRLEDVRQVTPRARQFLITATLAILLFSIFQARSPYFQVEGGRHPRITSLPTGALERPWIVGNQPQPSGIVQPPWVPWVYSKTPANPPSTLQAIFAQATYLLFGSYGLSLWLWRKRRPSQSHQLALAVLLLGLSALGASLGFLARSNGEIAPVIDRLLPALVYPGVALLICGSSLVLTGLLDHWQLVRALGRSRVEGQ